MVKGRLLGIFVKLFSFLCKTVSNMAKVREGGGCMWYRWCSVVCGPLCVREIRCALIVGVGVAPLFIIPATVTV